MDLRRQAEYVAAELDIVKPGWWEALDVAAEDCPEELVAIVMDRRLYAAQHVSRPWPDEEDLYRDEVGLS